MAVLFLEIALKALKFTDYGIKVCIFFSDLGFVLYILSSPTIYIW